jgi:3',5'-cyclic AMP phosphodiesterase CpdA
VQTKTLAHLSDLHVGRDRATDLNAAALCERLLAAAVDHVVITGDLTHRGRAAEYARFCDTFAPWFESGRITLVPGNHDRLGDDVASLIMDEGRRVEIVRRPGLHIVRVDSTAPHNRFLVAGHGALCERVIEACAVALDQAPPESLRVVLLHHHVLPAPTETFSEHLADWVALPFANELALGGRLLERILGHADLVLHGHRHTPRADELGTETDRLLAIYNAGSSTALGACRVFHHAAGVRIADTFVHLTEVPHASFVDAAPRRLGLRNLPLPRTAGRDRVASA